MELLKKINFIVVHHSQRKKDSPKRIKNFHKKIRRWEDIGYHYLIGNGSLSTQDGRLYRGRSDKFVGAHVFGHNKDSIGICLIGNFDNEFPTKKQIETLIKFLKEKMDKYKLSIKNILGHREFPGVKKTCPGKFLDMSKIRNLVKNN